MKLPKFNQRGMTHLIGLVVFIAAFASVGGYILTKSHAANSDHYLYGKVTLNGRVQAYAKVTLQGKNSVSYGGTGKSALYEFFPVDAGTYKISSSKTVGHTKYCSGEKTFTYVDSPAGDTKNLTLTKAACDS